MMKVDPKYKLRHQILTILFNKLKYNDAHFFNLNDSATSVEELASSLNKTVNEILTAHHGLTKHINCNCDSGQHIITLGDDGIDAFIDNYWLREGQKDLNERIYDKAKWIVPSLALLATVGSIVYTAVRTNTAFDRLNQQQKAIDSLSSNLKELTNRQIQQALILNPPVKISDTVQHVLKKKKSGIK